MLYNVVMLTGLATAILGVLVFLFIFWKRLKEDYASELIFMTAFYIFVSVLIAWILSIRFFPDWFLWASFLAAILGLYMGILRFKLRFWF